MYTVDASGTCTIVSPAVWAGPTSISSTGRPPTSSVSRPSNVRLGSSSSMPSNSNSPKKLRNSSPTSPGAWFSAASIDGGTSAISWAVADDATISADDQRRVTSLLP